MLNSFMSSPESDQFQTFCSIMTGAMGLWMGNLGVHIKQFILKTPVSMRREHSPMRKDRFH